MSAITHLAEVARIEKYKDTNKYLVTFSGPATKLPNPIKLPPDGGKKGLAPQAPRYTSYDRLMQAKSMADVF